MKSLSHTLIYLCTFQKVFAPNETTNIESNWPLFQSHDFRSDGLSQRELVWDNFLDVQANKSTNVTFHPKRKKRQAFCLPWCVGVQCPPGCRPKFPTFPKCPNWCRMPNFLLICSQKCRGFWSKWPNIWPTMWPKTTTRPPVSDSGEPPSAPEPSIPLPPPPFPPPPLPSLPPAHTSPSTYSPPSTPPHPPSPPPPPPPITTPATARETWEADFWDEALSGHPLNTMPPDDIPRQNVHNLKAILHPKSDNSGDICPKCGKGGWS